MEIIQQNGVIFLVLAAVFAGYICWGIGANDIANAMGLSVGSGAITLRHAIVIAAVCEFLGALLAGAPVTRTIGQGILYTGVYASTPELLLYGMLAALLATAIWMMVATVWGWPISVTHALVGAIVGFGLFSHGVGGVHWSELGSILFSWFIFPLLGGALAYLLMISIHQLIINQANPLQAAKRWTPAYLWLMGATIALTTCWKGIPHFKIKFSGLESLLLALLFGVVLAMAGKLLVDKIEADPEADRLFRFASTERVFIPLLAFTAGAMSFAHGSNDVSNGAGPLVVIVNLADSGGHLLRHMPIPAWTLILGGAAMVLGLATYGFRVIRTIGRKITALTPSRAYSATLAAAIVIVLASRLGLPVSTSHVVVGAVVGVGLAKGIGALDLRVLGGMAITWLVNIPIAALGTVIVYVAIRGVFS